MVDFSIVSAFVHVSRAESCRLFLSKGFGSCWPWPRHAWASWRDPLQDTSEFCHAFFRKCNEHGHESHENGNEPIHQGTLCWSFIFCFVVMILGRKDDYIGKSSMVDTLPGYNRLAETVRCIMWSMVDGRWCDGVYLQTWRQDHFWLPGERIFQNIIPPRAPACANQNYARYEISSHDFSIFLVSLTTDLWMFVILILYHVVYFYPLYPSLGQESIAETEKKIRTRLIVGKEGIGGGGWRGEVSDLNRTIWAMLLVDLVQPCLGQSVPGVGACISRANLYHHDVTRQTQSLTNIHNIGNLLWNVYCSNIFLPTVIFDSCFCKVSKISAPHQGWSWDCTQSKGPLEIVKLVLMVESFSELAPKDPSSNYHLSRVKADGTTQGCWCKKPMHNVRVFEHVTSRNSAFELQDLCRAQGLPIPSGPWLADST